jgi:hypothetical protein
MPAFPTIGDHRIYRESAGAGESQSDARAKQEKLELEVREAILQLHQQNSAEHVADESERDETSEEAEDERDPAEELKYSDKRAHESRSRYAHARECARDTTGTRG